MSIIEPSRIINIIFVCYYHACSRINSCMFQEWYTCVQAHMSGRGQVCRVGLLFTSLPCARDQIQVIRFEQQTFYSLIDLASSIIFIFLNFMYSLNE